MLKDEWSLESFLRLMWLHSQHPICWWVWQMSCCSAVERCHLYRRPALDTLLGCANACLQPGEGKRKRERDTHTITQHSIMNYHSWWSL